MDQLLDQVKVLINNQQPEEALSLLEPHLSANESNPIFLQAFGEVLLETNDVENAYEVLIKSCELDPNGDLGTEKFLYLGQIIGGKDGVQYLDVGLQKLASVDPKTEKVIQKLNEGIFAKIEIWMTDLCMEPEAEKQCDDLINYSLELDNQNPETYSILASIRISQQRVEDAKTSIQKSWDLFQLKNQQATTLETLELLQPLITLAKYSIELEMYDLALDILSTIEDINDNILDIYYLQTICHLFKFKLQYCETQKVEGDYRDLELDWVPILTAENEDTLNDIRSALTNGYKIINSQEDLDPEVVDQVNVLLNQFGGPLMSHLMPIKVNEDDEQELEQVDSDDEL